MKCVEDFKFDLIPLKLKNFSATDGWESGQIRCRGEMDAWLRANRAEGGLPQREKGRQTERERERPPTTRCAEPWASSLYNIVVTC